MLDLHHYIYRYFSYDGPEFAVPRVGVDILLPSGPTTTMVQLEDGGTVIEVIVCPSPSFGHTDNETLYDRDFFEPMIIACQLERNRYLAREQHRMTYTLPVRCTRVTDVYFREANDGTRFLRIVLNADRSDPRVTGQDGRETA